MLKACASCCLLAFLPPLHPSCSPALQVELSDVVGLASVKRLERSADHTERLAHFKEDEVLRGRNADALAAGACLVWCGVCLGVVGWWCLLGEGWGVQGPEVKAAGCRVCGLQDAAGAACHAWAWSLCVVRFGVGAPFVPARVAPAAAPAGSPHQPDGSSCSSPQRPLLLLLPLLCLCICVCRQAAGVLLPPPVPAPGRHVQGTARGPGAGRICGSTPRTCGAGLRRQWRLCQERCGVQVSVLVLQLGGCLCALHLPPPLPLVCFAFDCV